MLAACNNQEFQFCLHILTQIDMGRGKSQHRTFFSQQGRGKSQQHTFFSQQEGKSQHRTFFSQQGRGESQQHTFFSQQEGEVATTHLLFATRGGSRNNTPSFLQEIHFPISSPVSFRD
jgi:hypothetical protein